MVSYIMAPIAQAGSPHTRLQLHACRENVCSLTRTNTHGPCPSGLGGLTSSKPNTRLHAVQHLSFQFFAAVCTSTLRRSLTLYHLDVVVTDVCHHAASLLLNSDQDPRPDFLSLSNNTSSLLQRHTRACSQGSTHSERSR